VYLNMQIELLGISKNQLQEIYDNAIRNSKSSNPSIMFLDASYIYTFHLDDAPEITKMNKLIRYQQQKVNKLAREKKQYTIEFEIAQAENHEVLTHWHSLLERWYNDQTVRNSFNRILKPLAISRSLDRVTNQGMESIAIGVVGEGGDTSTTVYNFRSIGDGAVTDASPADTEPSNVVDVIDVNNAPEGGSLSRDGTTIYSIGNHAKTVATPANGVFTECGMHNTDDTDNWLMFDHSIFDDPIPHTQNADAPGSSTIIYMCSA